MAATKMLTDNELINRAKEGNELAFQGLVERYQQRVAATVIGMLGQSAETEDVGQEVFIRFYKSLNKFRGESSLGTYLTRIAINLSLNELKRRKRKRLFSFFSTQDEDVKELQIPDHSISQEQRETQQMVHQAIQMLDTKFRTIVLLRLIEGYSTKETAEILELPIGTVLSRLARAQDKLKDILTID
ncbi:MAG: sigma-70 family RNA polymerase sigma factor [Chitinophagales bacterium]